MAKATDTEVYQLLSEWQIPYERVDHQAVFTVAEIDFSIDGSEVKNLLMRGKKSKQNYLIICPSQKRLDIKALAKDLGENHLSFVSAEGLFDLLGLTPGAVTPLALPHDRKREISLVIDQAIDQAAKIVFHPNVNTATLVFAFTDFQRYLAKLGLQPMYLAIPEQV